jgi:CBS domain containing-hemolysin-like protein
MVTLGTDAGEARRRGLADPFQFLLLVGHDRQPIGWLDAERLPLEGPLVESMANPTSPLLNKRTTLRDALSLLLDASVQIGIVTDRTGAVTGLVTIDMIAERMRSGHRSPAYLVQPSPADLTDDAAERSA